MSPSNFIHVFQQIYRAPQRPALSLNIRMSSGPILRHLRNSWSVQGVLPQMAHTYSTSQNLDTLSHSNEWASVSKSYCIYPPPHSTLYETHQNISPAVSHTYNTEHHSKHVELNNIQHFAEFMKPLKSCSNRTTLSPPLIWTWWLPVPQDCLAAAATIHCSASA